MAYWNVVCSKNKSVPLFIQCFHIVWILKLLCTLVNERNVLCIGCWPYDVLRCQGVGVYAYKPKKYHFNKITRAWLRIFAKWNHDSYKFMTKAVVSQSVFLSSHSQDCYAQSSTTCRRCSDSYRHAPIWWESLLWQWLVLPDSTHICFLTIPSVMDKPAGNKDRMAIHRGIWAASARKNGWQHRAVWIIKKGAEKWRGRDKIGTGKEMPLPCLCRVKWYELLFDSFFLWRIFP